MKQFKPPVAIKERSHGRLLRREVYCVEAASEIHLLWPGRGKAWRHAANVLSDALRGEATPQAAREAFLEAAREAGALIESA